MYYPKLILKPKREKSVLHHHPWIYSGAIQSSSKISSSGETVVIKNSNGEFLAWGTYNPKSQIASRVWSWDKDVTIDEDFIKRKIINAFQSRNNIFLNTITNSYRVFYSESDGIPGLVLDLYGNFLVLQITSAGAEYWRDTIVETCRAIPGIDHCYERSESEMRHKEGLPPREGIVFGSEPKNPIEIVEWDIRYLVEPTRGQKTGFFLDQRQNRKKVQTYATNGRVLNCFSYTGGFSLNAYVGGAAETISIETSRDANHLAKENWNLNSFPADKYSCIEGDVFQELRKMRDNDEKFDLIVLDPPKFAPTYSSVPKAARAYKDINLLAFKLLRPGGILFTFSCSGGIEPDLFQKIVQGAALDAKREVIILEKLRQDIDHPVPLHFPEAEYLKGMICRVVD
jgi:23S rRNA (cytosine1962-C5)-methyltransferase